MMAQLDDLDAASAVSDTDVKRILHAIPIVDQRDHTVPPREIPRPIMRWDINPATGRPVCRWVIPH